MIIEIIKSDLSDSDKITQLNELCKTKCVSEVVDDKFKASVLHWTTYNSGVALFDWLYQKLLAEKPGLAIELLASSAGDNILFYAAKHANAPLFWHIYKQWSTLFQTKNNEAQTIAHCLLMSNKSHLVKDVLLADKLNPVDKSALEFIVNQPSCAGVYPLHLAAAEHNHFDILKYMISDLHIPVDQTTKRHFTALHSACNGAACAAAQYLIQKGADIYYQSKEGNTILHTTILASVNGENEDKFNELLNILLKQEWGETDKPNNNGELPLHMAARLGKVKLFKTLYNSKAILYRQQHDISCNNYLTSAIKSLQIEIVQAITELEEKNEIPDNIKELIKNRKTIFNDKIKYGNNVLHALMYGVLSAVGLYNAKEFAKKSQLLNQNSKLDKQIDTVLTKARKILLIISKKLDHDKINIAQINDNGETTLDVIPGKLSYFKIEILSLQPSQSSSLESNKALEYIIIKLIPAMTQMLVDFNKSVNIDKTIFQNFINKIISTSSPSYATALYECIKKSSNVDSAFAHEEAFTLITPKNISSPNIRSFIDILLVYFPEIFAKFHAALLQMQIIPNSYNYLPILDLGGTIGKEVTLTRSDIDYYQRYNSYIIAIIIDGNPLPGIQSVSFVSTDKKSPFNEPAEYNLQQRMRHLHISHALLCYATHLDGKILYGLLRLFIYLAEKNRHRNRENNYISNADIIFLTAELKRNIKDNCATATANLEQCAIYIEKPLSEFKQATLNVLSNLPESTVSTIKDIIEIICFQPHYLHNEYYVQYLHDRFMNISRDYTQINPEDIQKLEDVLLSVMPYINNEESKKYLRAIKIRCMANNMHEVPSLIEYCTEIVFFNARRIEQRRYALGENSYGAMNDILSNCSKSEANRFSAYCTFNLHTNHKHSSNDTLPDETREAKRLKK